MVLGSVGDFQWGSIVPPLHSGVSDNVQVRKAVKKGSHFKLVGPLWMTGSSERQKQRERLP